MALRAPTPIFTKASLTSLVGGVEVLSIMNVDRTTHLWVCFNSVRSIQLTPTPKDHARYIRPKKALLHWIETSLIYGLNLHEYYLQFIEVERQIRLYAVYQSILGQRFLKRTNTAQLRKLIPPNLTL